MSLISAHIKGVCALLFYFSIICFCSNFIRRLRWGIHHLWFISFFWSLFSIIYMTHFLAQPHCCRLNFGILQNSNVETQPPCDGVWRWGLWRWWGHKCGARVNGASALMKKGAECSFPSPRWRRSKKTAVCKPGIESSADGWTCRLSEPWGICFIVYKPPCLQCFLTAAGTDSDTHLLPHDQEWKPTPSEDLSVASKTGFISFLF